MASISRAKVGRAAAALVGWIRRVMAVWAARLRWPGVRRHVPVSRLSDDWLRTHERDTAKHDAAR